MDTDRSLGGDESRGEVLPPEKQALLEQILALRDSIEAESGILPESWTLVREDRER
jgi:hypothetical protein